MGSTERTVALLSRGSIGVDDGIPDGDTPLMLAANTGNLGVVRTLLSKGAKVLIRDNYDLAALHMSARHGHLDITKLLMKAGSDLEAATSPSGYTPLHNAAEKGHLGEMSALIKAGAKINRRTSSAIGMTALYLAAQEGKLDAVKLLLRAKADPSLTTVDHPSTPLSIAAENGHSEIVREMIQQFGIERCGGENGGELALARATRFQHVDCMRLLMDAGAVDTNSALFTAAFYSCEKAVKFLLQRRENQSSDERASCVHVSDSFGQASVCAIESAGFSSVRIVRLLVDA